MFCLLLWWESLLNMCYLPGLFSLGCTSELINPLHEDKPASTWTLPRCFCPTHFNISLDLEISKEKGVGRKVLLHHWASCPGQILPLGWVGGGRRGKVETPRQRGNVHNGARQESQTLSPAGPGDHSGLVLSKLALRGLLLNIQSAGHRAQVRLPDCGTCELKQLRLHVRDRR